MRLPSGDQAGFALSGPGWREPPLLRSVSAHHPDLVVASVHGTGEGDLFAVRRPSGGVVGRVVRKRARARAVRTYQHEVGIAQLEPASRILVLHHAREHDLLPVGRPGRGRVNDRVGGEAPHAAPVGPYVVDIFSAAPIARKCDPPTVTRPGRCGLADGTAGKETRERSQHKRRDGSGGKVHVRSSKSSFHNEELLRRR
jgi:hypothetical protein